MEVAAAKVWSHVRLLAYAVSHEEMIEPALKLRASQWGGVEDTNASAPYSGPAPVPVSLEMLRASGVPDILGMAIPGFFMLISLEFVLGLLRGRNVYRLNDTVTSIMLGSVQTLFHILCRGTIGLTAYCWVWSHSPYQHLVPLDSWLNWVALLLAVDYGYYWFHRTAHEYHLTWSAHSVHHSGEDYNLATALRQGSMQYLSSFAFKLLPALFFSPAFFVFHSGLNTLGQFWIHTQLIGSLGPLEYILNTPSHHRMHHRPPGNCNYAGVLILWDRLHGTFQAEDMQRDYYGLAKQYDTHDPLWANMEHPKRVFSNVGRRYRNSHILVRILRSFQGCFKKRARHPFIVRPSALFAPIRYSKSVWKMPVGQPRRRKLGGSGVSSAVEALFSCYALAIFASALLGALGVLKAGDTPDRAPSCLFFMLTFSCVGRLFDDQKLIGLSLETLRLCIAGYGVHQDVSWISSREKKILPAFALSWVCVLMTAAVIYGSSSSDVSVRNKKEV